MTTGPFVIRNLSATSLYAWEDYDDFESGIIDTEKWETAYFSGGREAQVLTNWYSSNVVKLWGETFTGSDPAKLPESATSPEWQNVLTDSTGEGNSGILIFDDSIIGVQAKLLLDYSNVEQAGVFISAMFSGGGIELVKRGEWFYEDEWDSYITDSPYFSYDIQDETGAIVGKKLRANTGSWYEVAVIRKNNKDIVFVDGEKLSEIDSPIEPEAWIIGAFNDAGQPFSAHVDDVRVLRRSDTEFNADALVADEISAQRDLVYLQTENGPELIDGAGEINFEIFLPQQPEITAATLEVDGVSYNLIEDQGSTVFRTRYGFGLGETNELYDIESSSDSDWSAYVNGKSFNFSLTHNGVDYIYSHQLPGASALPSAPNLSINGVGNWKVDAEEGHSYLELIPAQNVVVSWEPFQADDEYDHIFIALSEWVNEDDEVDVFEHVLSNDSTHFEFSRICLPQETSIPSMWSLPILRKVTTRKDLGVLI